MRIINSMFSKGLGGIEQAFIDYSEALATLGHEVICVSRLKAKINIQIESLQQKFPEKIIIKKIPNYFGNADFFTKFLLNKIVSKYKPDSVICHGNRPCELFRYATKKNKVPQIGVIHNYWFRHALRSDFLFCVSTDIRTKIITHWFGNDKVFRVPNLIKVGTEPPFKPRGEPPVIGIMARMIEKKGVDVFIKALNILNERKIKFKAIIGGEGELRNKMQSLRDELKLNDKVSFTGWVNNKEEFYNNIDIFCLPSLSEPFGIVLLEAMVHKKPIVSTDIEGPAEILQNNSDAILVEKGSSEKLADGLEELILNREKSLILAYKAFWTVKNLYDLTVVAKILESAIEQVISKA